MKIRCPNRDCRKEIPLPHSAPDLALACPTCATHIRVVTCPAEQCGATLVTIAPATEKTGPCPKCGTKIVVKPKPPAAPEAVPRRDAFNSELRTFYKGLNCFADSDLIECDACKLLLLTDARGMSGAIMMLNAIQRAPQAIAAFVQIMKGFFGEQIYAPTNVISGMGFLEQFVLAPCKQCNKLLCPACRKGREGSSDCVLCAS